MQRSLFNRLSASTGLIPFALFISVGCAASKDARPSPVGDVPPEGTQVALASPNANASTTPSTTVGAGAPGASGVAASSTSAGAKDSAAKDPPVTVPTIKGRTKKDSLALVSAVKAGLKNNEWPVKTAPQLPQAILP